MESRMLTYARTHMQFVRICWANRPPEVVGAEEAVYLCSDYGASGHITGVVAQDQKFTDVLSEFLRH